MLTLLKNVKIVSVVSVCVVLSWAMSNYIVDRGLLTPCFMKTLLYYLPPFFKFYPTPFPNFHLHCSTVVLFFCHIWFIILCNDIVDLHMSSLGEIVPEGSCCVFYEVRRQVYRGLTHCGFLLVLWFAITQTQTKTRNTTVANRLTHAYKYILRPPVASLQQLSVLHWMNNLLIPKVNRVAQCLFLKVTHL